MLGAFALSGCSTLRLGWTFGPWFLEREAQKFLVLPAKERPRLNRELKALMDQFGGEAAPELAGTAEGLANLVEEGKMEEAWELGLKEGKRHWEKGTRLAVQAFAPLLATADPQRQKAMREEWEKRDQKDFSRYEGKSPEELARAGAQRTKAALEKWLVEELTPEQEASLLEFQLSHPTPWTFWKAERLRHRGALLAAQGQGAEAVAILLKEWWLEPQKGRSPEAQAALEAYQKASLAHAKKVFLSFNASQRASVCGRLRSLGGDLAWIAARYAPKKA